MGKVRGKRDSREDCCLGENRKVASGTLDAVVDCLGQLRDELTLDHVIYKPESTGLQPSALSRALT